jgi:hypothetical protein
MEDRMKTWKSRTGAMIGAGVLLALLGQGALAQGLAELDRALAKPDPSGELLAGFNELVSATTNIAPPSDSADQDKAKVAEVRTVLQDPHGVTFARDPARRADAEAVAPQIAELAATLEQNIGDRLSADAKAGLVNDFKTVAQYMVIARPGDLWYCQIHGTRVLLPC